MSTVALKSHAKLNLSLEVLYKRSDGYHEISTIFEKIDLADTITLKPRQDALITVSCREPAVPINQDNLCYKSAKLLQEKFSLSCGVQIKIIKRIPVGAGLGGGSSNAAAVLLGLNRLWRLNLSQDRLVKLAQGIGSDVPFFLSGLAFAEGRGRGEKIRPLKGIKKLKLWHVLVVPKLAVSTPFIYQRWDSLAVEGKEKAGLTIPVSRVNIITLALVKKDLVLLGRALCNSLQEVTVKFYPEVSRVTKALVDLGAQTVLMSGSGPAVFTLCTSQREALFLRRELDKQGHSWRVFLAQTA